jgi:RNA polymerase sigma factor (sigma-70 family)
MTPPRPQVLLSLQSDEHLARLAREGNEQAFAVIVERYRRELYVLAGRMRSHGRADDLVQQTFLSAFMALRAGTEVKHLRGWLYRILRNEVIRTSRRPIVEVELDPASVASEPLEEASQRRMLAFDALSSIAALPDRQRDVLVASALNGESRAAVAGSMGLSEGAVRQLMHRARATLRAAAAAITPVPLVNWVSALRDGPASAQGPEIALGTGSAAGVALKLGAILASGAVATGIVGSQLAPRSKHPTAVHVQAERSASTAKHSASVVSSGGAGVGTLGSAPGAVSGAGRRGEGITGAGTLASVLGVAGASSTRDRGPGRAGSGRDRGSSGGEHHGTSGGDAGSGGSHSSRGDGGSSTGSDGGKSANPSGVDGGSSSGSGGTRGDGGTGHESGGGATGVDGGGSGVENDAQSATGGSDRGAGAGLSASGADSGSGSSSTGTGRDSSGDMPSSGSSGAGSSTSGGSGGGGSHNTESSGSDGSSGK